MISNNQWVIVRSFDCIKYEIWKIFPKIVEGGYNMDITGIQFKMFSERFGSRVEDIVDINLSDQFHTCSSWSH